jgi:hypothetical protein
MTDNWFYRRLGKDPDPGVNQANRMKWLHGTRRRTLNVTVKWKNLSGGRGAARREPVLGNKRSLQLRAGRLKSPARSQDRRQYRRDAGSHRVVLQLGDQAVVSGSLGVVVNQPMQLG